MYKPREGQVAWFFHRVSGLAIFAFLFGHILSTSVVVWGTSGPAMHEKLDAFYRLPMFTLVLHPLLFAAILYHVLNGIRIIIIDWWAKSTSVQKKLFYAEMALFVVVWVLGAAKMMLPEWQDLQKAQAATSTTAVSMNTAGGIH